MSTSKPPSPSAGSATRPVVLENGRVKVGDHFTLGLHRTLRVPEEGGDYPLPPGLGLLPVFAAADWAGRIPAAWVNEGALLVPLHQREALWLGFDGAWWRPNAVTIRAGGINVITGAADNGELHGEPQNYLVTPEQPWLDGFYLAADRVRQFVAVPLGVDATVAEQLGSRESGALVLRVYEPDEGRFPGSEPGGPRPGSAGRPMAGMSLGFAAGGRVKQRIYRDQHGVEAWLGGAWSEVTIHAINTELFEAVTGRKAPASPVSAADYSAAGLPWFSLFDEVQDPALVAERLGRLKSLAEADPAGSVPGVTVQPQDIVPLAGRRRTT
jgi:hypothetical protein